jgi:CHAT domain-containing protein
LGEKYNIHALGAVADVIDFNSSYLNSTSVNQIVLFGGIDYDRAQKLPTTKSQRIDISSFQQISDLTSRGSVAKFGYLPGSLTEVKNIETMGRSNHLNVVVNSGENATETAIKNLGGKKEQYFLHIATHGYFFPDVESKNTEDSASLTEKNIFKCNADPLFRSGLIFSGANHTWGNSNYVSDSSDDGILTSYEISNLDLSSCQLVVLSACETGLGDIKGSEGVFGLQRAFKMAGVKNIIMSLWRVPDKETQELMTLFYHYCFSGKSIHDALQAAQSEMKLRGYAPYYWAGFKLLE